MGVPQHVSSLAQPSVFRLSVCISGRVGSQRRGRASEFSTVGGTCHEFRYFCGVSSGSSGKQGSICHQYLHHIFIISSSYLHHIFIISSSYLHHMFIWKLQEIWVHFVRISATDPTCPTFWGIHTKGIAGEKPKTCEFFNDNGDLEITAVNNDVYLPTRNYLKKTRQHIAWRPS